MTLKHLSTKTQEWVYNNFIENESRTQILKFEEQIKLESNLFWINFAMLPLLLSGMILAFYVAINIINDDFGLKLDIIATTLIFFGIYLKWISSSVKSNPVLLSAFLFLVGGALIISSMFFAQIEPYRASVFWMTLLTVTFFVANRNFKKLLLFLLFYFLALFILWHILPAQSEWSRYLFIGLLIGSIAPGVYFILFSIRSVFESCLWFAQTDPVRWIVRLFQRFFSESKDIFGKFKKLTQDTRAWFGGHRIRALAALLCVFLITMVRPHFPELDLRLFSNSTLLTAFWFGLWLVFISLLTKEKQAFSRLFASIGSIEIMLELAHFSSGGIRLEFSSSLYHSGRLSLVCSSLFVIGWAGLSLTRGQKKLTELFQLGPLGLLVATYLLAIA